MAQPADWEECLLAALDLYQEEQESGSRGLLSALPGFFGIGRARSNAALRSQIPDPAGQAAASLVVFGFAGTEVDAHARRMINLGACLSVSTSSHMVYLSSARGVNLSRKRPSFQKTISLERLLWLTKLQLVEPLPLQVPVASCCGRACCIAPPLFSICVE